MRLGQVEEAQDCAAKVKEPTDLNVVHIMQLVYEKAGMHVECAGLYEHACKFHPKDEATHLQLFMVYVKLGNYANM